MVTERELTEGIAKCIIGEPTPAKMLELASYYIVKQNLFGEPEPTRESRTVEPTQEARARTITTSGSTEFLTLAHGKDTDKVMRIMDELTETVKLIQPKMYDSVIRKLREI